MNLWTGAVPLPYLPGDLDVFISSARGLQAMGVYGWGSTLTVERLIQYQLSCYDFAITCHYYYTTYVIIILYNITELVLVCN